MIGLLLTAALVDDQPAVQPWRQGLGRDEKAGGEVDGVEMGVKKGIGADVGAVQNPISRIESGNMADHDEWVEGDGDSSDEGSPRLSGAQ